jgi:NADP-dependent 3-hydroxy acid dehydrogenase YdfG
MAEKIWFVTGASKGFGRAWTQTALKRGDKVPATARKIEDVDDLADAYGDAVLPLALDVTDRTAVFAAIGRATSASRSR